MTTRVQSGGRAQSAVRRVILFVILFALVAVGATGISGLLERVLGATSVIVSNDAALALSLAYALIAGPLAGVLWWWERRRLIADPSERASLAWALYVTAMSLTSLIVSTTALVGAAAAGIDGEWRPAELSTGIVWLAVWFWHRHMRRSAATAPTRLVDVPTGLGAIYGLAVAASGAITLIAVVLTQAILGGSIVIVGSQYWLTIALQSLLWCAMGTLVWWWHWFREQAKDAPGGFASVLVIVVVAAAAATTLFAIGGVLLIALRLLFDTDPAADIVSELDVALAAALVGAIVWVYHAHVLASRSARSRRAARLVVSAIALVGAASGFGVVVNSLLATFSGALVGDDSHTAAGRRQFARGRRHGVGDRLATDARGGAGGGHRSCTTRLPRRDLRRERRRRDRDPPHHRLPDLRVRPRGGGLGWLHRACSRAARPAEFDGGGVRLSLHDLAPRSIASCRRPHAGR